MNYFWQCSCLETNPCVLFFTISLKLEEAVTAAELELNSLLFRFYGQYGLKNLWIWCIKQILTALLFGEWYKIIVPLVKLNPSLLFTSAYGPRWIVGQGWVSPRDNNFQPLPSWAVNICVIFVGVSTWDRKSRLTLTYPAWRWGRYKKKPISQRRNGYKHMISRFVFLKINETKKQTSFCTDTNCQRQN